jgi:16S rRNA (cytidine1402-2'-O)-methyltransferase
LTFVPTPLGNLRDITQRALEALRDCDLLVAEDTRVARRLLAAYGIAGKPLWSYREQNAAGATAPILERAARERVAVVTDAGMPGISDPGRELLNAARAAGVAVEVLPGPVAFVTAAVLSGFATTGLSFEGFVPRSPGARERAFRAALERGTTSAWYEAPRRLVDTLEALQTIAPETPVFVARELTKLHEQQILGTPAQALALLEQPVRGEVVLVLDGQTSATGRAAVAEAPDLGAELDAAFDRGLSVAAAAKDVAHRHALARESVYALAAARKRERRDRQ